MRTTTILLWGALALAGLGGCGAQTTNLTPEANKKTISNLPEWFVNTPDDPNYIFATATMTSKDLQMAVDKASTAARTELARQMETKYANLTKQFQEEVGAGENSELLQQFTSATKAVTQQTLNGSKIDKKDVQTESGIYRAYVLMSLPIGTANQMLMEKIKANQNLYTRFRSTKAFEELDKELGASKKEGSQ